MARYRTKRAQEPWLCSRCREVVRPPARIHVSKRDALCGRCYAGWLRRAGRVSQARRVEHDTRRRNGAATA
jgi:hypothetical protein